MAGYVAKKMRSLGFLSIRELTILIGSGRKSLKAFFACFRNSLRSQRKRIRFAQPARIKSSTMAIATLVFPVPVA